MLRPRILVLRAVLAVVFSIVIGKFFFETISVPKVAGLAAILFGLAYILEYARNKQ